MVRESDLRDQEFQLSRIAGALADTRHRAVDPADAPEAKQHLDQRAGECGRQAAALMSLAGNKPLAQHMGRPRPSGCPIACERQDSMCDVNRVF